MEKNNALFQLKEEIVRVLKNIYDPEIPVNIYDLGLIYNINVDEQNNVEITMTLTAPNCPIADQLLMNVKRHITLIDGIKDVNIKLVFDPPWDKSMMSDEALLELGML
jgi:FeS assembly SUF system protein